MAYDVRDITHATSGSVTGFISGSQSSTVAVENMMKSSTFNGDVGTSAYGVGDIVTALKQIGVLAN